jgi:nitrous oxidase accessory protein NosD
MSGGVNRYHMVQDIDCGRAVVNRVIDLRVPSNIRGISLINDRPTYVKSVHCHHGMAHPRVAERGDGLQIWRVAVNILCKQSRTADSGWSSSMGVGRGANNPPP